MPVRVIVTEGTRADCKEACALIDGVSAGALLADRGYDTESILRKAGESGYQVVIPPKKSRKILRNYDRELYKVRHLVENAFLYLKRLRGVATVCQKMRLFSYRRSNQMHIFMGKYNLTTPSST